MIVVGMGFNDDVDNCCVWSHLCDVAVVDHGGEYMEPLRFCAESLLM